MGESPNDSNEDDKKNSTTSSTYPLVDLHDEDVHETPTPQPSRLSYDSSVPHRSSPLNGTRFSLEQNRQLPLLDTTSSTVDGITQAPTTAPPSSGRRRGNSLRTQMFTRMGNNSNEQLPTVHADSNNNNNNNSPPPSPPPPPPEAPKPQYSPIELTDATPPGFGPHNTDIYEEPLFPYAAETDSKKKKHGKSEESRTRTQELLPNYSSWAQRNMGRANRIKTRMQEGYERVRQLLLRTKHIPPSKNGRVLPIEVPINRPALTDERTGKPFCSNVITSSIYTPYTFLPRQLVAQFSKLANIYFMAVSILQMIPSWSTTGNYTTIVPLLVFITISMLREGFDDWRRHRQDKVENNRLCKVAELNLDYQNHQFDEGVEEDGLPIVYKSVTWKDLKVGDVVKLKQNEWVPADIVLLHSDGDQGVSYIETMALDGETNLKSREALPDLSDLCGTPQKLASVKAEIVTEDPNMDLYNFEAKATVNDKTWPLGPQHVVYRGSVVRNTPSLHGIVVFTGEESKIRMNAVQVARTKAPRLQKRANKIVLFLVAFVLFLAIFSLVASKVYYSTSGSHMWYLTGLEVGTVPNLMGFIIMYNTLIPLSLYVSMEIVKVCQMLMLQQDIDMYHAESDTPLEAKTATINEELGQVSYIFSDKTGTLTDNVMLFRKFTVAGQAWLHDLDLQMADAEENKKLYQRVDTRGKGKIVRHVESSPQIGRHEDEPRPSVDQLFQQVANLPRRKSSLSVHRPSSSRPRPSNTDHAATSSRKGPRPSTAGRPSGVSTQWRSTAAPAKVQDTKTTLQLLQYLQTNPNSMYSRKAKFFLLGLAVCHSCLPETSGEGAEIENVEYQSASPDELALVEAARDLGYIVIDRQHHNMTVRTYPSGFDRGPVDEVYTVLETIEFSSARKRMSVVVKFPDGRICVFCKGADNIVLERLRNSAMAQFKAEELNQEASQRKAAEAEMVVARNSISNSTSQPRVSISGVGRPSLSGGRASLAIDRKQALSSLDNHFQRAKEDTDVEQIAESSRRSMNLAREKKYGNSMSVSRTSRDRTSRDVPGSVRFSVDQHHHQQHHHREDGQADEEYGVEEEDQGEEIVIDDKLTLNESYVMERTLEHIDEFSTEGLRTLMYGFRWMDKEEYDSWAKLYQDARTSLVDRQEKIEKVGEAIEREFELLGATAIEDKLQEGVPEAIDKLRRANIRLWMLTGDKRETAINIGYSCRLIRDYSTVIVLKSDDGDVAGKMAAAMLSLDGGNVAHCVVVVDGLTLSQIEQDMTLMTLFIDLGVKADSVICCRASPAQKSAMVSAVRKKVSSAVCLAIGDGANDIAMIRSADVGIGITGKEGLQAARSSDYSIAQFRYLLKLLLVHGRWNYVRICKYILGTFYKEFLFYLTQAIYQRNTLFTGTSMYENWSLSMFNTLFTSLPVLCVGIMERDLSPTTLIAVPELYSKGQRNEGFGLFLFLGWMCVAASESVIVSFLTYYLYGFYAWKDNTMYPLGALAFTACLSIICFKLQISEMYTITVVSAAVIVISVGGWMIWDMFLSYVYSQKPSKIYFVYNALFKRFGRDLSWWCALLATVLVGMLLELVVSAVRLQVAATETEVFQQLEHDPAVWRRLKEEANYELAASNEGIKQAQLQKIAKRRGVAVEDLDASDTHNVADNSDDVEGTATSGYGREAAAAAAAASSQLEPHRSILNSPRKRDRIKKTLRFAPRKTSGEYEREIEEILERRERQMDRMD